MWRFRICWAVGFLMLAWVVSGDNKPVRADAPLLTDDEQEQVNNAIDRGKRWLLAMQRPDGTWDPGNHPVGHTALAGLTLIECGVPPKDKIIQAARRYIYSKGEKLQNTYELSACILFLDAVGDPKDRNAIQTFAMRLVAGQTQTGGWGYSCPLVQAPVQNQMYKTLRDLTIPQSPSPSPGGGPSTPATPPPPNKKIIIPQALLQYPVFWDPNRLAWMDTKDSRTDNSCTHFAILGLLAARRHNVPLERTMQLLVHRFRKSQNGDGGWGYEYGKGGSSPQMTCIGLLGMAVGFGLGFEGNDKKPEDTTYRVPRGWCIKTTDGTTNEPVGRADKPQDQEKLLKAFHLTQNNIGQPANRMKDLPLKNLYYLWALERVAVLYNLRTIGDRDWYRWTAEMLVANQELNGAWEKDGGFPGQNVMCNTCMALLILKRANLASDLSRRLPFDPSDLAKDIKSLDPTPPPPPKVVETVKQPEPPPKAPEPAPVVQAPPPTPEPPEKSKLWLWILLAIALVLLIIGGILAFLFLNQDEDEEKKPKKKRKADSTSNGKSDKAKKRETSET